MSTGQVTEGGREQGVDTAASIGARLKAARKARVLEADTVARELNLDVAVIEALENDNNEALPAPIFVKGYLRNYARLVGLPEDELVSAYAKQVDDLPPLTVTRIRRKTPSLGLPSARVLRNVVLLMLVLIMVWLAWPFVERLLEARDEQQTEQTPGRIELPPARQGE